MKSDRSIQELWGEIIKEINEIMIDNQIEIGKISEDTSLDLFEKIKDGKEHGT